MKVKNIMFSGLMAAILMGTAGAQAAVEIASKGYVDTEVAKKASATDFADLKGVVENAETGLATKASKTELQSAQTTLQNAINLKANAADVYTKDEADSLLDAKADSSYVGTIPSTAAATNIVAYVQEKTAGIATDTALEELTGRVATAEGDIGALEAKVGSETVATQISSAITALNLANTYDAKGAAEAAETAAKGYTDTAIAGLSGESGALTTLAAGVAANEAAIALKADQTTVEGIQTTINKLGDTYATDTEVAGVKSELEGKIDAKVATETYNAKVGELEGAIATNKSATETNAADITTINESAVMKSGITAEKRAAYDQAVTDLTTKITMPEICKSTNCVLSTLDGVPTWV